VSLIFHEVIKTYPKRPKLNAAEWPYRKDELEDRIDYWMRLMDDIGSAPTVSTLARRRQLLHNGRKP
jgi:hypothetical protein